LQLRCQNILCQAIASFYFRPMKLFSFLISLYMLLLACMPCNDSRDCSAGEKVSMVLYDQHDDHGDDTEHCTPLCVCACCAAPVVYFQQSLFIKNFAATKTANSYPDPFVFSNKANSIWQPPRC
jgi:hypothetical protein